jgi:hypothetical protein
VTVAIDAASSSPTTNSVSSKTWSHTVSGSNRLLLVMVQWNQPNNSEMVTSVTYGGVALTQVGSNVIAGGSGLDRCTALFRLIAPATGTANIVVTMSAACTFFANGVSFTGVDQTTPLGTPQTATTTTAATLATTTSSAATNLVFSAATVRTPGSLTVPATSEWNVLIGTNNRYGGSVQSGATSVTTTYSWTGADNASMIAVDVKASFSLTIPASASMAGTAMSSLTDDFATADTAKWQNTGGGAWAAQVAVVSGRLNITVESTYHSLESVNTYDLRNSSAAIQIIQRPTQGGDGSTEMGFGVRLDAANNWFSAILNGSGNIVWRTKFAGVAGTTGYTPYNATTMQWLRWRSDGTSVFLEAAPSANGPWTQLTSYPVTFSIAALRPYVYAGYYGTQASPGTAIFDNFNASTTKTISAGARLSAARTRTVSAKASLVASSTLAVGGLAFGAPPSRSVSATSYVTGTATKTIGASASLVSGPPAEVDLSIRPVVGALAEEIYGALGPLTAHDEENDWALLRFVSAIAKAPQVTDDLVRDSDAGPGWSSIVDLDRAPADALPWLAQFVGVDVATDLDEASQRLRIRETSGFRRGTLAAIEGAARQYLTGSRTVQVQERDTSPYHLKVTTFQTETPVPDRTAEALQAQKPAGLVLQYVVSTGATYDELKATGLTYDQLAAAYPTYTQMKLAIPA